MKRAGFTLFEVLTAGILLGTVFVSIVPTLGWIARQRRETDRRQQALVAAENALEQLTTLSWAELTPERAAQVVSLVSPTDDIADAGWHTEIAVEADALAAKKLSVEISWNDLAGKRSKPVRLTTWVYRSGEAAP